MSSSHGPDLRAGPTMASLYGSGRQADGPMDWWADWSMGRHTNGLTDLSSKDMGHGYGVYPTSGLQHSPLDDITV